MRYRCSNGHEHSICWNSFNNGNGCPICATESTKTKLKLNFSKVKDGFGKEGYIVLSKEDEYKIKNQFDLLNIIYKIDLVFIDKNTKKEFLEEILKEGIEI